MAKKTLTIQEAADVAGKSVQTIRRAIKAKKLSCKKQRTPQGFNYVVNRESLCLLYNLKMEEEVKEENVEEKTEEKVKKQNTKKVEEKMNSDEVKVSAEDFRNFTKTLDRMVTQHSDERQNFMRLVNTLQEKIFVLENQMNLLKEPKKRWYQVWK